MNAPVAISPTVSLVDLADVRVRDRIEAYVNEHNGSLFHRPTWLSAVEAATGHRAVGLVCERLGFVCGWLPLTELRSLVFGNALVSSGFGVGGGIISDSDQVTQALVRHVETHALTYGFSSVELRGGALPDSWQSVADKHCGFERELAADDDAELLAIPRKSRAEVRKGLKNGLEVRIGRERRDLAAHYAVYAQSVRNLGTPVFPRRLFVAMLQAFPDSSDILTVLKDGKPISSVLSFYHDGAVMPFWGGGTFEARASRANELMYYQLMRHARRREMSRFDFGRSKTASGPYKFKKNWGFEPQPLTYGLWSAPGQEPRDIDPTSASYARKIALWKKLPLPVANAIGPLIARDLG